MSGHQFHTRQPGRAQHCSAQALALGGAPAPTSPLHLPNLPRSIGKDAFVEDPLQTGGPAAAISGSGSSTAKRQPKSSEWTCLPPPIGPSECAAELCNAARSSSGGIIAPAAQLASSASCMSAYSYGRHNLI